MRMKKVLFFLTTILILQSFVSGSESKKEYKWKIDDLLTSDRISEIRISPDSKLIAWSVRKWDLKSHKTYNVIFYSELRKGAEIITLTRSKERFYSIRWVPEKSKISFKTSKKFPDTPKNNLWVINLKGGEPYPVTKFKNGLRSYEWVNGNKIVYLSGEEKTLYEIEKKKRKDTSVVVEDEDHRKIVRLFSYSFKSKERKRLTKNIKPITNITISQGRTKLIYSVSLSLLYGQDQKIRPAYYIYDLQNDKVREIFADRKLKPAGIFAWSPDDRGFYAIVSYSTHPVYTMASVNKIYYYDIASKRESEIDLKWDRYSGWRIIPLKDGFIAPMLNGVNYRYARFYKKGNRWARKWIAGKLQKNISSLILARDQKTLVYAWSTASKPTKYFRGRLTGTKILSFEEILKINSPLNDNPMARTEIIKWKGALDDEVEGILYYPLNYEKGKRYPLIVMIHGGPHGADMDFFRDRLAYPAHLMAERGAFSLKVNYHGSSNYGIEFGESIAGHYYEYEIPDIEKGVDLLINKGLADPDRLGIIGWSNGAILGTALNISTDRYKVASLGAGDVNWTSDYGNCAFGVAFDNYYFGGPPWEKLDHYIKKSPLFKMKKVVTPTLIFHGTLDRAVPYEQGWEYYRALKEIGKAPVKFISFPGEGHGPRKLAHQRRKLKEETEWFEKYLFGTYKKKNESIKKGSPLEMFDKFLKISKSNGLKGVKKNGKLIPETVKYKKMNVGRFEVTRAQWKSFDDAYGFSKGTGNYPVSGIGFEKMEEYSVWLSKLTGEKYRLPTEKEGKKLYSARGGNIFDYWAGFRIGPDDYKKAVKYLLKYKPGILLKEVGMFKPVGSDPVFDLGGNVAEWVSGSNGEGHIMGGSALTTSDKSFKTENSQVYSGFRVVKE